MLFIVFFFFNKFNVTKMLSSGYMTVPNYCIMMQKIWYFLVNVNAVSRCNRNIEKYTGVVQSKRGRKIVTHSLVAWIAQTNVISKCSVFPRSD